MSPMKICRVCGGIACGFNYDVLTCESCKVFFCRSSSRLESLRCDYGGNCEINIYNRKRCAKCRLIKCYAIGMKKRPDNRVEEETNSIFESEIPMGAELILEISILKGISEFDIEQLMDYVTNQSDIQRIQKKRIPLELNQYELTCIAEARNAISVFRYERNAQVITFADSLQEMFKSTVHNLPMYIKKTINYCQNFGAFNSLSSDDQLSILKPLTFNLASIWFIFQYELKRNGVFIFTDETETNAIFIGGKVMEGCYKNPDVVQQMSQGSISFHNAMENDVNIRDLLAALVLFNTRSNLSCPENIRYHYYLYCSILQRYLQYKHRNKKEANRKYGELMCLLDKLQNHFEEHKKVLASQLGAQNMPSIVRELYDLV